jgi:protoheme IX farnesyltransferase
MKNNHTINNFRFLLAATAMLVFLTIIFGGLESLTESPDQAWLALTHRITAVFAGLGVIISLIVAWVRYPQYPFIRFTLAIALIALLAQSTLGGFTGAVLSNPVLLGIHFTLSALILALTIAPTGMAFFLDQNREQALGFDRIEAERRSNYTNSPIRLSFSTRFSRATLWAFSLTVLALISGVVLANSGARWACTGWPLCEGTLIPTEPLGWIPLLHRLAVGLIAIYILWFNRLAWRTQRNRRAILTTSTVFVLLFFAQSFVGALKVTREFPLHMLALHEATAAALIGVGALLVLFTGAANLTNKEESEAAALPADSRQRIKDFLALTKPIVVTLLLSTTFAGMVIAAGKLPSGALLFWTMLGGALAAGGSSAINQYIDRELDAKMNRTAARPIPAGRLTPAEGLAFGTGALILAFYLLAGFVNILAALLSLAGMVYYVILYSVYLKNRNEQNIVIGGGAGAIPPLVGWAAATGSLNLTAGFLFMIIFLWTPPHFWALALLRKSDYARGGVPMMPVVRGERETQVQMFIYTLVLVAFSLLLWLFGSAGWIYLIGALILGAYLIYLAWQVLKAGRNKTYYRMYRHSNYYLLLLFVILAADALI